MNIFYLDHNPVSAARAHCDKHVVKMVLETAQLLSTAHHVSGTAVPGMYKQTHTNHPCAVWVRASSAHYDWTYQLLLALCEEFRYRRGFSHKAEELLPLLKDSPRRGLDSFTDPPCCMPIEFQLATTVESYRNYYRVGKASILSYNWGRPKPNWL